MLRRGMPPFRWVKPDKPGGELPDHSMLASFYQMTNGWSSPSTDIFSMAFGTAPASPRHIPQTPNCPELTQLS